MDDMLEKLPILEAKLILKKKELESKKKVKEENNNKVIQEQYNPNKVMELEYELKNLENDKILAQNKNKKLKSIKIKTIIFSLFNLLGSFFTSICCYGIGAGMSNAYTASETIFNFFDYGVMFVFGSVVFGFLEHFIILNEYKERKDYLNQLNLNDIENKIEETKNKISLEKEKKIENKKLKKLEQEGSALQEKINNIVKEIKDIETLISEIISEYEKKNSNFVNLEKDLSSSKVK